MGTGENGGGSDSDPEKRVAGAAESQPAPSAAETKLVKADAPPSGGRMSPVPPAARLPSVLDPQAQNLFSTFLGNQTEELKLKGEELKLRSEEQKLRNENDARQYEFATRALAAQSSDAVHARDAHVRLAKFRYNLTFGIAILVAGTLVYAMASGCKEFAMEALKLAVVCLGGGGLGYGVGRSKAVAEATSGAKVGSDPEDEPASKR